MSKSGKSIFVLVTGNIILFVFTGFSSVLFKYSSCRSYKIMENIFSTISSIGSLALKIYQIFLLEQTSNSSNTDYERKPSLSHLNISRQEE